MRMCCGLQIHPVIYPALSGIIGAQSELFAKSAIELIKTTFSGTNQFATFGTYAITLSMFTCIFLQVRSSSESASRDRRLTYLCCPQIHWLAHGLQSFDAVFVVPVFQCFFISVSIFGGGVYFKEFSNMSSVAVGTTHSPMSSHHTVLITLMIVFFQFGMFFFGAGVTLSGVFLLSQREMNKLSPTQRLRACAKAVVFIKRVQKTRKMDYKWRQPPGPMQDVAALKSAVRPAPPLRLAKASVVPINASMPSSSMAKIVVKPLDSSSSAL
ncbi:hypothetical protein PINS_up012192 [Pythium insidiosum]|nr:hypothetical protein PINS_up012192 [Pythium insidiosum]